MAFPTTSVIETFTGSNGTSPPNANWTNLYNSLTIQGNSVTSGTLNDWSIAMWDTATFGPDSEAYMTISTIDTSGAGLFVRITTLSVDTFDGYLLSIDMTVNPDAWTIEELLNGGGTVLTSGTQNIANGEMVGLEVIGSAIKAYHYTGGAWSQKLSTTDGTYGSAGYIGCGLVSTSIRGDDFGGGTVVTEGSSIYPGSMGNTRLENRMERRMS